MPCTVKHPIMQTICNLEFHPLPDGGKLVQGPAGYFEYSKETMGQHKDFTEAMERYIDDNFTEAYDALREWFRPGRNNVPYFRFCIVDQFIACNSCGADNKMDIDEFGILHVEHVYCPIRNRCPRHRVVCYPKPNTPLSRKEYAVMELYDLGYDEQRIADRLDISEGTVLKHKANVFQRMGIHTLAEFIRFARDNNIFRR